MDEKVINNAAYASSGRSNESSPENPTVKDEITWKYLEWTTPDEVVFSATAGRCQNGDSTSAPDPPNLKKLMDPMAWPTWRKNILILLSCIGTAFTAYASGMYAPGVDQMIEEFGINRVAALVGVTIFTIGFGVAPMVLAPFSELEGRRPVFVVCGVLFLATSIACGGTHVFSGMLIARFIGGCASSTFSTMVGGVVADVYDKKSRNAPMSLFAGSVMFGTGFGPLIGALTAYHISWRWIFWVHSIVIGVIVVAVYFFFEETRGSVLLSRKAKKLNEWYDKCESAGLVGIREQPDESGKSRVTRIRWKCQADEERGTLVQMVKISLFRPILLLFTEPTVFFFSLWVSFAWGILFCEFDAIPYVFQTTYKFNLQQANAPFTAVTVSGILITPTSILLERYLSKRGTLGNNPEGRLWISCFQSAFLPVGIFWFGWAGAYATVPWIVPSLGIACCTIGIFSVYLASFNYLADTYGKYASSAIAAQSFSRNMMGGAFPLFTDQMFEKLGIGGASSLLGGIALLLTLVPWVLALNGPKIRARSKFTSEVAQS